MSVPPPNIDVPDPGTLFPFRQIVFRVAEHVFRYKPALVYTGSGSGDKVFDWVQAVCLLAVALIGTCIWSAVDPRRSQYNLLYRWFRVFIRFALAGTLFSYGFAKVIPTQMHFPFLTTLLEPYGDFSPASVLWFSVGSSPAYEIFVGTAELLAGMLLVLPATSMLGALICLVDMVEIFVLNMTYDIPVKLFSFNLLLLAVFLLIPYWARILRFCFSDGAIEPQPEHRFFTGCRANRIAIGAQILVGLVLFGVNLAGAQQNWYKFGGGAAKSPFYGIWTIDEMVIDGAIRAPLLTDYDRWRRVIFEYPQFLKFQRMNDSFVSFSIKLDAKRNTITLTNNDDKHWKGELSVHRQDLNHMIMDGWIGVHKVRVQLTRMDRDQFLLVNRGFHWVQDYPFYR
jgi:hypothetical protein